MYAGYTIRYLISFISLEACCVGMVQYIAIMPLMLTVVSWLPVPLV